MSLKPPPAATDRTLDVTVCLHGAVQLVASGSAIALERKLALLLAYLWIEAQASRSRLAGLLWPEVPEARARANLRQRLSVLRRLAGAALITDGGATLALVPGLCIEPPGTPGAVLLAAFDYDDCPEAAAWVEGQRRAQRAGHSAQLRDEVRAALRSGRLDDALRLADELLALDRESEEAYRMQMEVLYLRGDTAAAIAVWDRCTDMLRQLYGVVPSAATRQLGQTLLTAAAGSLPIATPEAIPVSVLRPPKLIARRPLLRSMLAGWRGGSTVLVSGEAGLGKSRLLSEFVALAGPCAAASARPRDADQPYASLGRLLQAAIDRFEPEIDGDDARQVARLLPRLAALLLTDGSSQAAALQTEHERRQCLRRVAAVLADCMARGCCALLLDDLHCADAASLEAVVAMAHPAAGDLPAHALRFVLGARSEELGAAGTALLGELGAGGTLVQVELQELDAAGVAELVGSLALPGWSAAETAELAARLWQQVGGNPAFVLESVKLVLATGARAVAGSGLLPVAPDMVAVMERRIGLLSPQARHLAQLAAVAGDSFGAELAAAALACSPADLGAPLRELELRQVLVGRQFVHDVIAVAVNHSIPQTLAEFMHRFVAEYLAGHGGEPVRRAAHWQACGDHRRAGDAYAEAAEAAAALSRPSEQCQLLDCAVACYERCGANDAVFDALVARQDISAAPDRGATRLARMQRLEALARTDEQRLRALLLRQGWQAEHGHAGSAEAGLDGARQALALGQPGIAFEFARCAAWQLAMRGDEAGAVQTLQQHRPWAMAHGAASHRADFHASHAAVLGLCDRLQPAIEAAQQAVIELRAADRPAAALPLLCNMGLFLHWRSELDAARATLQEAAELRDLMHGRGSALLIDVNLAAVLRDQGDYLQAESLLVAALDELRAQSAAGGDMRTDVVLAENHLAQLWLCLGQPTRASELIAGEATGLAPHLRARRMALRLRTARLHGVARPDWLLQAQALVSEQESPFHRTLLELELVCALPASQAQAVCDRLLGEAVVAERPGLLLHATARAAQARLAQGDVVTAARHANAACRQLRVCPPFDIDRSEVWWIVAGALRSAGDSERADEVLAAGAAWLQQTARDKVAPAWRAGFIDGHPANRRLMQRGRQRLAGPPGGQ